MRETIPDSRPKVIELLQLLASEERQLAYGGTAPDADTTSELFLAWCDTYRYGDREFEACFNQEDFIALARFSAFYQASRRRLPESRGTTRTLLAVYGFTGFLGALPSFLAGLLLLYPLRLGSLTFGSRLVIVRMICASTCIVAVCFGLKVMLSWEHTTL